MKENDNVVYRITTDDECEYVGSTGEFDKRIKRHIRELLAGNHHNQNLQSAFDNGSDLVITKSYCDDRDMAYYFEEQIIRDNNADNKSLNIGLGSKGGDNLTNNPRRDVIVRNKSVTGKAYMKGLTSEERKEKYGLPGKLNGMYGKTHTAEVKQLLSAASKGNTHVKGHRHTETVRNKLSELAKQRTGEKNAFFGKSHSEETKAKLSAANKGKLPINTQQVAIGGRVYESKTEAARVLGVSPATICYRLNSKSGKYSHYKVIS